MFHPMKHYLADRGNEGAIPVATLSRVWDRTDYAFVRVDASEAGFGNSNGREMIPRLRPGRESELAPDRSGGGRFLHYPPDGGRRRDRPGAIYRYHVVGTDFPSHTDRCNSSPPWRHTSVAPDRDPPLFAAPVENSYNGPYEGQSGSGRGVRSTLPGTPTYRPLWALSDRLNQLFKVDVFRYSGLTSLI